MVMISNAAILITITIIQQEVDRLSARGTHLIRPSARTYKTTPQFRAEPDPGFDLTVL